MVAFFLTGLWVGRFLLRGVARTYKVKSLAVHYILVVACFRRLQFGLRLIGVNRITGNGAGFCLKFCVSRAWGIFWAFPV